MSRLDLTPSVVDRVAVGERGVVSEATDVEPDGDGRDGRDGPD